MYQTISACIRSGNTLIQQEVTNKVHLDLFPDSTRILLNKKYLSLTKTRLEKFYGHRKDIANGLGISVCSLDHYLYGRRAIPLPVILKISKVLRIPIPVLEREASSIFLASAKLKISDPCLPIIKDPIFYMIPIHLVCDGTKKSVYFQGKTELISLFKLKLNHVFGNVETSLAKRKYSECYVLGASFLIPRFYNFLYPEIDYKTKKLPISWLTLPTDYLLAMLVAFIIDEGYLYYGNHITISNKSRHLHEYVLSICHKLGYRTGESFRSSTGVYTTIIFDVKKLFENFSMLQARFGSLVSMGYKETEGKRYLQISMRAGINRYLKNGKERIVRSLEETPKGLSLKQLLFTVQLSKTTVTYHLKSLIQEGAVVKDKCKNTCLYKFKK
ncbi:MAG: hypothetical protein QMD00_00030 [Hadesarchaea archaeon]|nr:hypothetical protein [Hadesarchaea archaeon]